MAFTITNGPLGVNVTLQQTKDDPQHQLGTIIEGTDPATGYWKRYKYVYWTAAKTAHLVYEITQANQVTDALTATTDGDAPIQLGVFDATTSVTSGYTNGYGWIQVAGYFQDISLLASCGTDTELYSSATAGKLDDATANGKLVHAVKNIESANVAAADKACYSAVDLNLPTDA